MKTPGLFIKCTVVIVCTSVFCTQAQKITLPDELTTAVADPITARAENNPDTYPDEPKYALYISQLPDGADVDIDSNPLACTYTEDGSAKSPLPNLYRGVQNVIDGGCFGDLDDEFDSVLLTGTADDNAPVSYQVSSWPGMPTDYVNIKSFIGAKQCEEGADGKFLDANYTFPLNSCFKPEAEKPFYYFVSRVQDKSTDDLTLTFYEDGSCTSPYGKTLEGGGPDICIGSEEYPSPGTEFYEGYMFKDPTSIDNSEAPIEMYDITRWIRGTDCQEGVRSAVFGTSEQETVPVVVTQCTEWNTDDDRKFYVKVGHKSM